MVWSLINAQLGVQIDMSWGFSNDGFSDTQWDALTAIIIHMLIPATTSASWQIGSGCFVPTKKLEANSEFVCEIWSADFYPYHYRQWSLFKSVILDIYNSQLALVNKWPEQWPDLFVDHTNSTNIFKMRRDWNRHSCSYFSWGCAKSRWSKAILVSYRFGHCIPLKRSHLVSKVGTVQSSTLSWVQ